MYKLRSWCLSSRVSVNFRPRQCMWRAPHGAQQMVLDLRSKLWGVQICTLGFPWNSWLDSGWTKWAKINWSETPSWECGGRDTRVYGFTYCLTCECQGQVNEEAGDSHLLPFCRDGDSVGVSGKEKWNWLSEVRGNERPYGLRETENRCSISQPSLLEVRL